MVSTIMINPAFTFYKSSFKGFILLTIHWHIPTHLSSGGDPTASHAYNMLDGLFPRRGWVGHWPHPSQEYPERPRAKPQNIYWNWDDFKHNQMSGNNYMLLACNNGSYFHIWNNPEFQQPQYEWATYWINIDNLMAGSPLHPEKYKFTIYFHNSNIPQSEFKLYYRAWKDPGLATQDAIDLNLARDWYEFIPPEDPPRFPSGSLFEEVKAFIIPPFLRTHPLSIQDVTINEGLPDVPATPRVDLLSFFPERRTPWYQDPTGFTPYRWVDLEIDPEDLSLTIDTSKTGGQIEPDIPWPYYNP